MRFLRYLAAALIVVAAICTLAILCWGPATVSGTPPRRATFERLPDGTIVGPNGQPVPPAIQQKLATLRAPDRRPPDGLRLDVGNLTDTTAIELVIAAAVVGASATRHTARRRARRHALARATTH
jgi:hypothetical protein